MFLDDHVGYTAYFLLLLDLSLHIKGAAAGHSAVKALSQLHLSLLFCKYYSLHLSLIHLHYFLKSSQGPANEIESTVPIRNDDVMMTGFFSSSPLTSIKLLFHNLAWILRTAWPEKLWRGHWNRTQRADPKRQSCVENKK